MNCPNCSNTIDSKTKFCPYCDAAIEPPRSGLDMVAAASVSTDRSPVVNRYVDLYRTAHVITGVGTTVKTIGIVVATIIFFFWFIVGVAASETPSSPFVAQSTGTVSFFVCMVIGVISSTLIGGLFFLLGVLISAQGQLLMAHADSAVHTSPFLSDKERAAVMSLPYITLGNAAATAQTVSM